MKHLLLFVFLFFTGGNATMLYAQNVMINVITQNAGVVKKDKTIFFEITINNTSPNKKVSPFKLKPQISFPTTLLDVPDTGHILPNGWALISNNNGVVTLTNGTDVISENENRVLLIAIRGKAQGGPSSIMANLAFSNGVTPGTAAGSPLMGDNTGDNISTSTILVER